MLLNTWVPCVCKLQQICHLMSFCKNFKHKSTNLLNIYLTKLVIKVMIYVVEMTCRDMRKVKFAYKMN